MRFPSTCDAQVQLTSVRPSYATHLERRVKDIEEFLRPMRESRRDAPAAVETETAKEPDPVASLHPSQELGEVDACENPIDGMGAINFTDEEDSGFFGMSACLHTILFLPECIRIIQAHHPTSPSCDTSRAPSPAAPHQDRNPDQKEA